MMRIAKYIVVVLMLMPALAPLGIFPEPTAEMYASAQAWQFMSALLMSGYIMPLIAVVGVLVIYLLLSGREAFGVLLLTPFTVNVMLFHWFFDPTPISANSALAYVLLIAHGYLFVKYWCVYEKWFNYKG